MKRKLKMTAIILGLLVVVVLITGLLYINLSPHFGKRPSKAQITEFEMLGNYNNGKFRNLSTLTMELVMPIHWGGFTLALHDWTDPADRAVKKAAELNMPITTRRIGESLEIGGADYPTENWWAEYVKSSK